MKRSLIALLAAAVFAVRRVHGREDRSQVGRVFRPPRST